MKGANRVDAAGDLIEAAERHAASYDGDDRKDIKTDVLNAYYAGASWQAARSGNDATDAAKWRALLSCARVRPLGSAGCERDDEHNPDYAHIGFELWTHYELDADMREAAEKSRATGKRWLERFVEKVQRVAGRPAAPPREDAAPVGPIMLALARAARPRENKAVMQHLLRLIEAVHARGESELAGALRKLTEEPQHPFVPVRHGGAGANVADCPVCGEAGSVPPGQADGLAITPATLSQMMGIKIRPILLTLMRAGQSVTVNQKLSEDQIAFLVKNGVDR